MQSVRALLAKPLAQKAVRNFGWLVVERIGRLVLGVLVGLVVARYLGPAELGSLTYAIAMVTLLGFLPELGLDSVLRRELLKAPDRTTALLGSALLLRLGAGTLAYAGLVALVAFGFGGSSEERRLLLIVGLILFQPAAYLNELWLQVQLQAKRGTIVQLGALTVSAGLRLWLVSSGASVPAFAWVIIGELVLCTIGYHWAARGLGLRWPVRTANWATMRWLLTEAWPLMFANLAVIIYLRIDEVMLRHLADAQAVGVYAAAVKLSELCYFLPTALASSVLPALLRAREQAPAVYAARQQQYYDLSAGVAYLLSVPVALAAPWIVRLAYGPEFAEAAAILSVHIWASVFVFLGVARGQWLVNEGLQKFYLAATLGGAVANVILNCLMIPRWGGLGAAYATVISYALAGWLASYCHPAVRVAARAQTLALLIPLRAWSYLRRS